jgi:hypothetical protein
MIDCKGVYEGGEELREHEVWGANDTDVPGTE